MRVYAQGMADGDLRAITEHLAEQKLGIARIADAKLMPNRCASNPPFDPSTGPSWNGWSPGLTNARFQPAPPAGLDPERVPGLKLKWAFGMPGATAVHSQPTVAGGRVFVGVDTGYVYALDAASGCVYWSFQAPAGVRGAVSIAPVKERRGTRYGAFFGDMKANVYGVDATTGTLLWKVQVEDHPIARITGAPVVHDDRLYVPVSSREESVASSLNYPCCTFRGSVVALSTATGRRIWKTYTIAQSPKRIRKNSRGTQLWAPAGAAIWSPPTIDLKRRAIYVGTGNGYTEPAPETTDAVLALDMDTGRILWVEQDTEDDVWLARCNVNGTSENCPESEGPDYDFGAPPILRTLPDGRRILIAGQKSGIVWAHDPDRKGTVIWKTDVSRATADPRGEIVWGGAADDQAVYFGLNSGGLAAVRLTNGERKWFTPVDPEPALEQHRGLSGALTAIPGVVFSGGWDGVLRAFSTEDGRLLWRYDTVQEFKTVNGVAARGGSMGSPGPTVAGGMLIAGSGYIGVQDGMPGNVLLAFSAD